LLHIASPASFSGTGGSGANRIAWTALRRADSVQALYQPVPIMTDILLITKGHPYEREAFYSVFDEMEGVDWTLVEQPAAKALFAPEQAAQYDAFVCYDMPGLDFSEEGCPRYIDPGDSFKTHFRELLNQGHGFVFLHHAIAGWPAWPEYGDTVGGRFLYSPDTVRDRPCLDSGYRHDVTHTVSVLAEHPVTEGIPAQFEITDELYLYEVFEDEVEPLLSSNHRFEADNFYSAAKVVVEGKMFNNDGWEHPPGSQLIGWTKTVGKSRIVYLQCGDSPSAYNNPHYRRLLKNAIAWVSSGD